MVMEESYVSAKKNVDHLKNTYDVSVALRRLDDDMFRSIFPLSNAQASIIKIRLVDWLRSVPYRSQYLPMLEALSKAEFPYLCVVNIVGLTILNPKFYYYLNRAGYFSNFWDFKLSAKNLANVFKRSIMDNEIRGLFSELHNVLSFQVDPVPNELKVATEDFANSGKPRKDWFPSPAECMSFPDHSFVRKEDLDDFISRTQWVTSGSASFGKYEMLIDEKSVKKKYNKAQIPLFFNQDEIDLAPQDIVLNTFIKPEPAKRRMATAGDLPSYLIVSGIIALNNITPKIFKGSTLEATGFEEKVLNDEMLSLCSRGYWGCPYDFATFDHQPTISDLVTLHQLYANKDDPSAWPLFSGMYDTYLYDAQDRLKFKVTGGLMSGLRTTSYDGNAFAMYVKTAVLWLANKLKVNLVPVKEIYRGDDSSDFFDNPSAALLYTMLIHYSGLELGVGKFGIGKGNTEFLRNWYSDQGMVGYACRSIVAVNARKPWTNDEPDIALKKRSIIEGIQTTMRRCYCTKMNFDLSALLRAEPDFIHAPLYHGGIGFGEPYSVKYNMVEKHKIMSTELKPNWWRSVQQYYLDKYGLVGDMRWNDWALDHFKATVAEARPLGVPRLYSRTSQKGRHYNGMVQRPFKYQALTAPFDLFGRGKVYEDRLAYVNLFLKYGDSDTTVKNNMPREFNQAIDSIVRFFGISKTLAIDYYFGKLPLALSQMPARFVKSVADGVSRVLFPSSKFADDFQFIYNVWYLAQIVEADLYTTLGAQYHW